MLRKFHLISLLLILSFFSLCGVAQVKDTTFTFNPVVDDITIRIPVLEDLIDSAIIHSPILKSYDALAYIYRYETISAKRQWMENLFIDTHVTNDYYDGLNNNSTNFGIQNSTLTTQDNFRSYIGLQIRMPMDDLWDRKNRVKTARKWVEKTISEREDQIILIRKAIIEQYNKLITNQRILTIANDNQIYMSLQMAMAERDFVNGLISLYELARLNELNRRSVYDFETSRYEFYNAYMQLQELVGIKFNVINSIE
ncbi:TolC family protein [Bacteroidota bacterium]